MTVSCTASCTLQCTTSVQGGQSHQRLKSWVSSNLIMNQAAAMTRDEQMNIVQVILLSLDVGEERVYVGRNVQGVPGLVIPSSRLPALVQQELLKVPPFR